MSFMADYGDENEPTPGNWKDELKSIIVATLVIGCVIAMVSRILA